MFSLINYTYRNHDQMLLDVVEVIIVVEVIRFIIVGPSPWIPLSLPSVWALVFYTWTTSENVILNVAQ